MIKKINTALLLLAMASPMFAFAQTQGTPRVDLKVNGSDGPVNISANTAVTLSWTSSNVSFCRGFAFGSNDAVWSSTSVGTGLGTSGSQITGNLTSFNPISFVVNCENPTIGGVSDSVTVNVRRSSWPVAGLPGYTLRFDARLNDWFGDAYLTNTGTRVGIGTKTPGASLHIAGDVYPTGGHNAAQLWIGGASNQYKRINLGFNVADNYGFIQSIEDNVAYRALILNPAGGNVGIGTLNPKDKLQVQGVVNATSYKAKDIAGVSISCPVGIVITEISGGIITGATCQARTTE